MKLGELKRLLNSRNDLDECEVSVLIEDEEGGNSADLTFIDVDLRMGGVLNINLHGCLCDENECDHEMSYADACNEDDEWDEDEEDEEDDRCPF